MYNVHRALVLSALAMMNLKSINNFLITFEEEIIQIRIQIPWFIIFI